MRNGEREEFDGAGQAIIYFIRKIGGEWALDRSDESRFSETRRPHGRPGRSPRSWPGPPAMEQEPG